MELNEAIGKIVEFIEFGTSYSEEEGREMVNHSEIIVQFADGARLEISGRGAPLETEWTQ